MKVKHSSSFTEFRTLFLHQIQKFGMTCMPFQTCMLIIINPLFCQFLHTFISLCYCQSDVWQFVAALKSCWRLRFLKYLKITIYTPNGLLFLGVAPRLGLRHSPPHTDLLCTRVRTEVQGTTKLNDDRVVIRLKG